MLVPVFYLGLAWIFSVDGVCGLRRHALPVAFLAIVLLLVTTSFVLALFSLSQAFSGGQRTWQLFREIVIGAYFLGAVALLIATAHRLVRAALHAAANRILGSNGGQLRSGVLALITASVLLPAIVPYAIAVLYVHRFKLPMVSTPQEFTGRPFEDVSFATADKCTIRGWYIPARSENSSRTLLICHGLGANRSAFLPFLKVADRLQANVLMFDFRGHGESDGHTVSLGYHEKKDVLAAIDYLRRERLEQCRELVGMGISMGSASLIRAAGEVEPPLDAVLLDSGFTTALELTSNVLAAFPDCVHPMLIAPGIPLASLHAGCPLRDVRPIDQISHLRAPVFFIHSRGDRLIPVAHSERLHEMAREPKAIWTTATEGHACSLGLCDGEYLDRVEQFASRHLRGNSHRFSSTNK